MDLVINAKRPTFDTSDTFLTKILECAVFNQTNLQDPNQSGFKVTHATETTLVGATEKVHVLHQPNCHQSSYLDPSADNHKTLLSILKSLGGGLLITWRGNIM